jgi:imidazolonepropionase-like amidohydrolase
MIAMARSDRGRQQLLAVLALLVAVVSPLAQDGRRSIRSTTAAAGTVAIINASVVPMTSSTVLADHTVLLRDGVIVEVGPTDRVEVPSGAEIVDAGGRYLLPGLIDAHVHLRAESELAAYLRYGVTTLINMRGSPGHLEMRRALADGALRGPRMFTSGPLLDGDPPIWSGDDTRVVTTAAEAVEAVEAQALLGYDLLKTYNNLDPEVLAALSDAAHQRGLSIAGHLPRRPVRSEGLRAGLRAGLDLIAHGEEVFFTHLGGASDALMREGRYTPPADADIQGAAQLIKDAGAAVSPNLSFIVMTARMLEDLDAVLADPEFERLDPGVQEMWREQNPTRRRDLEAFRARERIKYDVVRRLTLALHRLGVPLLVGTDASAPGMFPGASAHVELSELVALGLTRYEALASATRVPGAWLQQHVTTSPALGTVRTGSGADLLLVESNPLQDLGTLTRPWRVIARGRVLDPGRAGRGHIVN